MPNLADIAYEPIEKPSALGRILGMTGPTMLLGTMLGARTPLNVTVEKMQQERDLTMAEQKLRLQALSEDVAARRQTRAWEQEDRPTAKAQKQEELTHQKQYTTMNADKIAEARREQQEAIEAKIISNASQGFRLGLAKSAQAQFGKGTVLDAKTFDRMYEQPAVKEAEIFKAATSLYLGGHKEAALRMLASGGLSNITEKNVMEEAPRLEKEANDAVYAAYTRTLGEGSPGGIGVNDAASRMTAAGMKSKEAYDWINQDLLAGFRPAQKNRWQIIHGLRAALKGDPNTPVLLEQMAALAADTGIKWKGTTLADMEVFQEDGSWLPIPKYLEVLEVMDPIEPAIQKQVEAVTAATEAKREAEEAKLRFSTQEKIRLNEAARLGKPMPPQDAATLAAFEAMERWPGLFSQPGKFKTAEDLMADEDYEKLKTQLPVAIKWIGERVLALTSGTAKDAARAPAPTVKKAVSAYFKAE